MKIDSKGPSQVDLPQHLKEGKRVSSEKVNEKTGLSRSNEAAQVSISSEARKLQKVAALSQKGDDARAEKVISLKNQISREEYHVEAEEVAKGIVRSEIARLLGES